MQTMRWRRFPVLLISGFVLAAAGLLDADRPPPAQTGLRIVVIAGEDAVNVIQQKTAVAPVVEVRDRNDLPVAGVPVTFAITSQNAVFAGGLQQVTVVTNAAGRAIVAGLNPLASGSVEIGVTAAYQGQTAAITITQTNVLTAAQGAGAAGGGGGNGLSALTWTALAGVGGAVGGVLAATHESDPPASPTIVVTPTDLQGIREVTEFTFGASGGVASTWTWDFGDGSSASGETVRHVFASEGTYAVRVRGGGSTSATQVSVGSAAGNWAGTYEQELVTGTALDQRLETPLTASLQQDGLAVTGTLTNFFSANRLFGTLIYRGTATRLDGRVEFDAAAVSNPQFRCVGTVAFADATVTATAIRIELPVVTFSNCLGELRNVVFRLSKG